jgi:ABC-type uncharacterized transport system substrate-binding protein
MPVLQLRTQCDARHSVLGLRRFLISGAGLAGVMLFAADAVAHPHVFIDNRVTLLFEAGKLTGFRTDWRFDEVFAEDMLMQFDSDGDGMFSPTESDVLGQQTLPNLAGFRYFTHASVDGVDFPDLAPSEFKASVEGGMLHFELTFTLRQPIDPRQQKLRLEISDREYYVEVLLAGAEAVQLEGDGAAGCKATVYDDPANAYYEGFVIPQAISVQCP